jgi:tetratricopeptide (TPR) repeat protein
VIKRWLQNIEEAIKLNPQNSNHFLAKSIFHFLLAEYDKAISAVTKAKTLAPKAVASPNYSLAFLYNFQGQFEKSREEYRAAMRKKTSRDPESIKSIIYFIEQAVRHFPDKKQLKLALGLLEVHRGSVKNGIKVLEDFLNDPPQDKKMQPFIKEAEGLLSRANMLTKTC